MRTIKNICKVLLLWTFIWASTNAIGMIIAIIFLKLNGYGDGDI